VSWYNPELDWAAALGVTAGQWQGEATQMLVSGGQWCRFKQTLTDGADGATVSDWVESGRFEMK
jgi:DNA-binding transcriptional regulator of glucitol operon